uniref:Uncharacterized protein n=2 Tax=Vibrionaceae TaxID=641 RepID=A0A0H3ZPW0_VIBSP|nr:hypothetical protein [Vibrio splendidus]AKN40587.1 hypothetical protein [Enterovibrio norvegicus]
MKKLTVKQVEQKLDQAAKQAGFATWKDIHHALGVGDRQVRRWRNKADTQPDDVSIIPTLPLIVIESMCQGKFVLPVIKDISEKIPAKYLHKASDYHCPPSEFLKSLVGRKQLLGVPIKEISSSMGISDQRLGDAINKESLTFINYAVLMMLCGVSVERLFYTTNESLTLKERLIQVLDEADKQSEKAELEAIKSGIKQIIENL